ncbi:hypothetical protein K7640_20390 [Micromonospora sp. PLK6-60]|uniref:hypothetical protein n=1 Tax=Micromonospora sp. PLK6-60 TaxID=2873383 RepID=UPI001CA77007|nr:hypothetical protein [Micromonospora sp. PLK6-60]MBY8874191.1 hypothetical protein [Micromonospora sp. PLK6-60]
MSEPPPRTDVPEVSRSRRRWLLPAAGLAVVLAVPLVTVLVTADAEPPAARPAAAPTSLAPTPVAAPTSPAPAATLTPTRPVAVPARVPTPEATRASTPTRRPTATRSTTAPATRRPTATTSPTPSCTPAGVVDVVQVFTDGVVKVAARTGGDVTDLLCPGERVRVLWATYRRTADGGATLYRSEVRYLDRSAPTWTMRLALSGACGDSWYVVAGNWSIPRTLKPGVVPFGRGKLNWETGGPC